MSVPSSCVRDEGAPLDFVPASQRTEKQLRESVHEVKGIIYGKPFLGHPPTVALPLKYLTSLILKRGKFRIRRVRYILNVSARKSAKRV